MKRSRSCLLALAASLALPPHLSPTCFGAPATEPEAPTPATLPATQPVTTQPGTTQPAIALPATQPATRPSTAPAPATEPATQPSDADHPPAQIRLNFRDTPLDIILERLSQDAGFSVVREAPVNANVTVMSMQPLTPAQAVVLLNATLRGEGLAAVQDGKTLRIVAREKAKKGNLPVHFGAEPDAIEATDELITQVIPVHNVDAVKLRQDLTPLIGTEADVTANAGANAIVMTDTSANIRRIVQIVAILDKREGTTSQVKIIRLKNASAPAAAQLVLAIFRVEEPKPQQGQPAPPHPPQPERLLGTGVDQALHGGKVTAGADERTNSVVVAAPAETLKSIEDMLKEIDENPATAATPGIKSFHLKVADATTIAQALRAVFQVRGGGASQSAQAAQAVTSHQATSEEPLMARVTVVPEEKTNTLIVTAPPAAMRVVEDLIRDVDGNTEPESTVRSFPLKYADAAATAKELLGVFVDPNTGHSRLRSGSRDKVGATADARTNTVMVTAPADAMPLVEKTLKDLDASPTSGADVKFFRLKQGDSDATAKLILGFFKPPEGATNDKRPPDAVHFGVNAVSDPRTNTVAVTAPPEAMAVVEQLVREVEAAPTTSFEIESFSLKNGDAGAAAKLLTTLFQPDAPGGAAPAAGAKLAPKDSPVKAKVVAAADDRTNTVVVTAPAETLKVIEGVVKLLDASPLSGAQIQVFQLQNADAQVAGKLLESIIQPPGLQTGAGGPNATGPKPPGVIDAVRRLGWVSTASDFRTNTLIVTAPPEVMKAATAIVRQIDANPASQQSFFMYRLRNGQSQNLEIVLNQLFGNTQNGNPSNQRPGVNGQNQTSQLVGYGGAGGQSAFGNRPGSLGGSNSGLGAFGGGFGAAGPSSLAGGTGIGARRGTVNAAGITAGIPQLSSALTRVATELTGQVYVVADPDTNALLVTTATRYQQEVRDIIAELDRPVPQVLIKVLIAEVTHDNNSDLGTDFSVLDVRKSGNGTSLVQNLGNAAANTVNGGLAVSVVENNITATLHALATLDKLDVLSRPYILASDNQLASITIGNEVPFITDTRLTETGQTINTIQYQDVGIILNVTPHINPEGLVILDVAPEISQITAQTVPISAGVQAPVIAKRSARSRVGIKNGQTVVIGGLMEDRKTDTVSKVPLLGDIPLLGELFKRTQTAKSKTELLIFLTPHVAPQPDALKPMSRDEVGGTKLTNKAVDPGVFEEHMRNMRRGAVPETRPAAPDTQPVIEFAPPGPPATQPGGGAGGPTTSGAIPLP